METIVNGADGALYGAKVDSDNRLHTLSVIEPEDKFQNRFGKVWSYYFTETPTGAGDYFFYFKNTGEVILAITDIRVMGASADTLTYEHVTGTPSYTGVTTITPVDRNLGSSVVPAVTCTSDPDITGLNSEGVVFFERIDTANKRYKLSTTSNIFIPQGQAFAIKAATGTALITCVVSVTEVVEF
jgi:hypothetical protein